MGLPLTDYLIVGQGLAGSLLAWELIKRGRRVLVMDDGHHGSSSMAASGMLNPVTGMRLVKTPRAEIYLPHALRTYRRLARNLGQTFYRPRPLWRLFNTSEEARRLEQRRTDPEYRNWLGGDFAADAAPWPAHAPHGGYRQPHAGYLDMPALLGRLRDWFKERDCLVEDLFDGEPARDPSRQARRVLLCQGQRARRCPWFGGLPFQPAKGEILTLRGTEDMPRHILNRGHWLLPTRERLWRLGASFDREHLDTRPTAEARESLMGSLARMTRNPEQFRVVGHQAGIRPATRDTQPFLGLHPEHPRIGIFNGFGAKGSLMIPWHAERFADHLEGGADLPPWADIRRYRDYLGR